MSGLKAAVGNIAIAVNHSQLDVFFLENLRRSNELRTMRGEYRFWIRHTVGFQHLQSLIKLWCNVGKAQFSVEFKNWFDPEWEPTYLVSPGGTRRPIVLANIASLVSGGLGGAFRR